MQQLEAKYGSTWPACPPSVDEDYNPLFGAYYMEYKCPGGFEAFGILTIASGGARLAVRERTLLLLPMSDLIRHDCF